MTPKNAWQTCVEVSQTSLSVEILKRTKQNRLSSLTAWIFEKYAHPCNRHPQPVALANVPKMILVGNRFCEFVGFCSIDILPTSLRLSSHVLAKLVRGGEGPRAELHHSPCRQGNRALDKPHLSLTFLTSTRPPDFSYWSLYKGASALDASRTLYWVSDFLLSTRCVGNPRECLAGMGLGHSNHLCGQNLANKCPKFRTRSTTTRDRNLQFRGAGDVFGTYAQTSLTSRQQRGDRGPVNSIESGASTVISTSSLRFLLKDSAIS